MEKIFENIEKVSPSKLREKLLKEKDKAFLSKKLACLDKNLPFDFEISELEIKKIDLERLMEIFTNLEFRRLQNYLYEIFPETKNLTINEDLIAFSNGETYKFEEIKENIDKFQNILADEKIEKYIVDIVFATREPEAHGLEELKMLINFGASPRASIFLAQAAKMHAFLRRRGYVTPEDVRAIGLDVMRHRVILSYEAEAEEMTPEDVVSKILNRVEVP